MAMTTPIQKCQTCAASTMRSIVATVPPGSTAQPSEGCGAGARQAVAGDGP